MAGDIPPWRLAGDVASDPEDVGNADWIWGRLDQISPDIAAHIAMSGVAAGEATSTDRAHFVAAAQAIAEAADLARIVRGRVATVHVLAAAPGYDVSHSEPCWRDRVFVSIPERSDRVGALRLAESVIHEAMHLHLTLYETQAPLAADASAELISPWRQAPRPVGGVLHGLFVFRCLATWLLSLNEPPGSAAGLYVRGRIDEIEGEIAQIDMPSLLSGLTPVGRQFASAIRSASGAGPASGRENQRRA